MQSHNPNRLDLDKIGCSLSGSLTSEIQRIDQERTAWMRAMTQSNSLAEEIKKLAGESFLAAPLAKHASDLKAYSVDEKMKRLIPENPLAVHLVTQWQELQKAEQESIRRMLDPLQDIHKGMLADSASKRILDDLAKPSAALDQVSRLIEQSIGASAFLKAMQSSIEVSTENARKMLADATVSSGIAQVMKSFEESNKRWVVPQPLLDALGPLQALQEQIGRLSLPVMDVASAATLARVLGPEGIQAQLDALGINADGSITVQDAQQEEGIGLSRKTLELMTLLGFILTVLVPLYQEISASRWQTATDTTLAAHTKEMGAQGDALEGQIKMIEALTSLVEQALVQETKRREERFVVRDRVAVVRSKPEHGSAVDGKLLPREVVRPISERGKWIEIEYYHWLHKRHRTGWALKKYFQRVPINFDKSDMNEANSR